MAALRGGWRGQEQGSLATSASFRKPLSPSMLYSDACRRDSYQPGEDTGDKRRLYDDCTSVASKFSRVTYNSRVPNRTSASRYRSIHYTPSVQRQESFKPGTIICADHFEEAYNGGSTIANDKSIIRAPGQKPICKKARFFVILAGHSLNYICVPVFSHNGNGTRYKQKPEEFVSIRDHRATVEAPQQSVHDPLVTLEMSGTELTPASVVHLAYPVSRSYGIPVTVIGRLTQTSTNQCIQLFRKYMPVEICVTSPASSTEFSIDAGMTVSEALTAIRLQKYARLFNSIPWSEAFSLRDKDLEVKGVTSPAERQQILSVLWKVEKASQSGPEWSVKITNRQR